jgi:hypothetical protein
MQAGGAAEAQRRFRFRAENPPHDARSLRVFAEFSSFSARSCAAQLLVTRAKLD